MKDQQAVRSLIERVQHLEALNAYFKTRISELLISNMEKNFENSVRLGQAALPVTLRVPKKAKRMSNANRSCSVVGCRKPSKCKGLCVNHYQQSRQALKKKLA